MQTLAEIRALLDGAGLSPLKQYGQNFLVDQNLVRKLVDAAGIGPGHVVLEVGPGTGTLTEEMLDRGCRVVAVEIDRGLAGLLRDRLGESGRFELVEGDCLAGKRAVSPEVIAAVERGLEAEGRPGGAWAMVANLPYQAGTPLLLALLVDHPRCVGMHVTVQREVAERFAATPASFGKQYGTVSVVTGCVARVRTVAQLPNDCFWPRPRIASSMIGIERLAEPLTEDAAVLAAFCQRAFAGRRKQLGSLLRSMGCEMVDGAWPAGVTPLMRIEEVPPAGVAALAKACSGWR